VHTRLLVSVMLILQALLESGFLFINGRYGMAPG
jgi:hypothetical protein